MGSRGWLCARRTSWAGLAAIFPILPTVLIDIHLILAEVRLKALLQIGSVLKDCGALLRAGDAQEVFPRRNMVRLAELKAIERYIDVPFCN
jgi:hypothetical protein